MLWQIMQDVLFNTEKQTMITKTINFSTFLLSKWGYVCLLIAFIIIVGLIMYVIINVKGKDFIVE